MSSRNIRLVISAIMLAACNASVPGGDGGFDTGEISGGDPGPPPPPPDDGLLCDFTCVSQAEECCPANVPDAMPCPAPAVPGAGGGFPLDIQCAAGECLPDQCSNASDCPFPEWQECEQVGGRAVCIYPCISDEECFFHTTGTVPIASGRSITRAGASAASILSQWADGLRLGPMQPSRAGRTIHEAGTDDHGGDHRRGMRRGPSWPGGGHGRNDRAHPGSYDRSDGPRERGLQ